MIILEVNDMYYCLVIIFIVYCLWILYGIYIFVELMPDKITNNFILGTKIVIYFTGAFISWLSFLGFGEFWISWTYNDKKHTIILPALFYKNNDDDYFE